MPTPKRRLGRAKTFSMGQTVATPAALAKLQDLRLSPSHFLMRHAQCDWSDMDAHDRNANRRALVDGSRIFSSYKLPDHEGQIWVITEADRSSTTVLLPDDY